MNKIREGFSIVELIITISIVIILSVVAVTSIDSIRDKSNNSKILSDIETLKNGFESYLGEFQEYPMPKGNLKFYTYDTLYNHGYNNSFGVSGFVTEEILQKKYINNIPLDPKTGQYYAYAKTKNTSNFEIAGVLFENNNPKSFVSGNWKGEFGPKNLVKEYAGPNFVFNNSTDEFPYNPYEKMLIAKILSYSGEVLINNKSLTKSEIFSYNLGEGDKISVGTGGTLSLYYSDGSNSILGDKTSKSEIILANMRFVEDNSLFTSIKLVLNIGSLWTKASKLSDKSEFEVYTSETIAAVRGTIFGLKKETIYTNIVVQEGKVELKHIILDNGENIVNKIKSGGNIGISLTDSVGGVVTIENGKSYINVNSGSLARGNIGQTRLVKDILGEIITIGNRKLYINVNSGSLARGSGNILIALTDSVGGVVTTGNGMQHINVNSGSGSGLFIGSSLQGTRNARNAYNSVNSGSLAKGIKISSSNKYESSTGAINYMPIKTKEFIIDNTSELSGDNIVVPIEYSKSKGITIKNNNTLKKTKKLIVKTKSNNSGSTSTLTDSWENTDVINLSHSGHSILINNKDCLTNDINDDCNLMTLKYKLSFCNENNDCTKEVIVDIKEDTNYSYKKHFVDCEKDINNIYNSILNRKPSIYECEKLIKLIEKQEILVGEKEKHEIIKNSLSTSS